MVTASRQALISLCGVYAQADEIQQVFWIGYREYEPKRVRSYASTSSWYAINFGGTTKYKGMNVNGFSQLKNYWYLNAGSNLNSKS
jgi:hypothetical protein